jgi:hypothetical protein
LGHEPNQLEEGQELGHQKVHDGVELKPRPLERVPRRRQGRVPGGGRTKVQGKTRKFKAKRGGGVLGSRARTPDPRNDSS